MAGINWRKVFRPGSLAHNRKGVGYRFPNSFRGLRWAKRLGKKSADRDIQITKDGVWVVCHWSRPLLHDSFRDPAGKVTDKGTTVGQMTWADVSRLESPEGIKIHTLDADSNLCGELGLIPFWEPKTSDRRFQDAAAWAAHVAYAKKHGVRQVRGYALPGNAAAVPAMRAAGIPATYLRK